MSSRKGVFYKNLFVFKILSENPFEFIPLVGLLTNNTAVVGLGGSGGVNLARQNNYYVEVGTTASTNSYIDFHSSNTTSDYDSRIIATSGTSTAGNGTINIIANTIQLYSNPFRYIPWTLVDTGVNGTSASLTNVINYTTSGAGSNLPTCSTAATIKYRYSVIGNTLYLNYYCAQTSGGTTGIGYYQYQFPTITGITINTTELVSLYSGNAPSVTLQPNGGTKIGTLDLRVPA